MFIELYSRSEIKYHMGRCRLKSVGELGIDKLGIIRCWRIWMFTNWKDTIQLGELTVFRKTHIIFVVDKI